MKFTIFIALICIVAAIVLMFTFHPKPTSDPYGINSLTHTAADFGYSSAQGGLSREEMHHLLTRLNKEDQRGDERWNK